MYFFTLMCIETVYRGLFKPPFIEHVIYTSTIHQHYTLSIYIHDTICFDEMKTLRDIFRTSEYKSLGF